MFRKNDSQGPWSCARCGSHNVALRRMGPGIPLLDRLEDWLGDALRGPERHWGARRVVCKDCGHVSFIHIM